MADDLGYADLSGYGRTGYSTPALDALASEGAARRGHHQDCITATGTLVQGLGLGGKPRRLAPTRRSR
jgi:hypothetical protein